MRRPSWKWMTAALLLIAAIAGYAVMSGDAQSDAAEADADPVVQNSTA